MDSSTPSQRLPEGASHPSYHWGVLALGILAVSSAAILIRLAQAPPLVVSAWRMAIAAIVLAPVALPTARRELGALTRRERGLLCLASLALAIHFATWISSLSYTTVSSSTILASTHPIFVALASRFLLREPVPRWTALGIAVATLGSMIVGYGDLAISGRAAMGDALALLGAMAISAHVLLGRTLRRRLSTLAYVWPCYGLASLILLMICLATRQPLFGYSNRTYLFFLLLALGPQVLGHSAFNWALAHFSPVFVTLSILVESIGASILAFVVLGEAPPHALAFGGPLVLAGVFLASRQERAARPPAPSVGTSARLSPGQGL